MLSPTDLSDHLIDQPRREHPRQHPDRDLARQPTIRQPPAHRADLRPGPGQVGQVPGHHGRRRRHGLDVVLGAPGGELAPVRAVAPQGVAARAASPSPAFQGVSGTPSSSATGPSSPGVTWAAAGRSLTV